MTSTPDSLTERERFAAYGLLLADGVKNPTPEQWAAALALVRTILQSTAGATEGAREVDRKAH